MRFPFFQRASQAAQDVLLKGLELVGIRYYAGGDHPERGLDCSGFVRLVYREAAGLVLPRTAREQSLQGEKVGRAELRPGDLVFFNTMRRAFSHVGIYLGDHFFLHAPRAGGFVRVESMQSRYWLQRYDGARRLLPSGVLTGLEEIGGAREAGRESGGKEETFGRGTPEFSRAPETRAALGG